MTRDSYISTGDGLNIFDGSQFTLFNLHNTLGFSNKITQTLLLKKGLILIGTRDKGLFVWDKLKKLIIPLTMDKEPLASLVDISTLFLDSNDIVWAGSYGGTLFTFPLSEIDSNSSDYHINNAEVITTLLGGTNTILEMGNTMYIGMESPKLTRIRKSNHNYVIDQPIEIDGATRISSLALDMETLFVGTDKGVFQLSGLEPMENMDGQTMTDAWGLEGTVVRSLSVHRNSIWVGTEGKGIYKFSTSGTQLEHFLYDQNKQNNLNSDYVLTSYIDSNENLWIGTWYGGINIIDLNEKNYSVIYDAENEKNLFSNIIWAMAKLPDGRTFLGTHGNGLGEYITNGRNFKSVASHMDIKSISSLYYDPISKLLFIGTWGNGIRTYDPNTHKLVPNKYDFSPLDRDRIYGITRGPDNNLWIGSSENGLYRLTTGKSRLQKIDLPKETPKNPTDIISIVSDRTNGRIWAGSVKNGLFSLKLDKSGTIQDIEQFETFTDTDDKIYVENLYIHNNGDLWILCKNGLGTVKPNNGPKRFPLIEGCVVTGLDADATGILWVATLKGIFKLDPDALTTTYTLSEYSCHDLLYNPMDNTILVGTDNGILKIEPDKPIRLPPFPTLMLSELHTLNQTITPQTEFYGHVILPQNLNYCDTIILPHNSESFSIGFNALTFTGKKKSEVAP